MNEIDDRPLRPGVGQIGEITPGGLAAWDCNGRMQDASAAAQVFLTGLPTEDPKVEGQLWTNAGVLMVSAGISLRGTDICVTAGPAWPPPS